VGKISLVIGGARSGKSALAESLVGRDRRVVYVATGLPLDDEMRERIRRHQARRPPSWRTFEQQTDLELLLPRIAGECDAILIDCATLYVSNMLLAGGDEASILAATDRLLKSCRETGRDVVIVSNEVGCGIVPDNPLGRLFRDVMGLVNQRIAATADEAHLVVAGIPMRIKPAGTDGDGCKNNRV